MEENTEQKPKQSIVKQDGEYTILKGVDWYCIKKRNTFLTTPGGKLAKTLYLPIAERLLDDWKNKGYESYRDPTSILSYHFTCQENFVPMKKAEIVDMLNSLNWEQNWTFASCPSPDPNIMMEWMSILGVS